jgi:soluble lytic murein transglycosylase-like protein
VFYRAVCWCCSISELVVTVGMQRSKLAGRRARIWGGLVLSSLAVGLAGIAEAQTIEEEPAARTAEIPVLEARVEEQDATLQQRIGEISAVGAELEETQSRVNTARVRASDLGEQTWRLRRELTVQRETFEAAKTRYEEKARAAYKGDDLRGLSFLLDGLLGSMGSPVGLADPRVAEILFDGRESLEAYRETERILRNTSRQISQKKRDYEEALREERVRTKELQRREKELEESIARISSEKARTEIRLQELRAAERARILKQRPATGGGEARRSYELRIARQEIVAEPVGPISKKAYKRLYRQSARKYGFGEDWYVLAAVGKVESNHGENMGPSVAGAMGPMQFLPSTWETAGVDGNGDGVANIMDPRDAIPAAARYLRDSGAPQDWYRALFAYNHADWYVKKVLGVAEGYRRLANDNTVGSYF